MAARPTRFAEVFVILLAACLLSACAPTRDTSKSLRSATEQLLLSQAVERSLEEVTVPMLKDATVALEVAGLTSDQFYVRDAVAAHLAGKVGAKIRSHQADAKYLVRVMVQALGTELDQSFFGMPQVEGGLIPIALPELPLYKFVRQVGYVRYALHVYDIATGQLALATPWFTKTAASRQYTVLFFFTFRTSTLIDPPELSKVPTVPIITPLPKEPSSD